MATLFGRDYTREELLQRVGDIAQVARVRPYRLSEGPEDGVAAVDVATGSGFEFTVLPGRGLDLSAARYNGRSLAWRSPTGERHAAFYEPEGEGWLRSFYGGLLVTCGLAWMGAAGEDDGQPLGLHGRYSHQPATSVCADAGWEGEDYVLSVRGKVREAVVYGENLQMTRRIRAKLGESRLFIEDEVENLAYAASPHMLLYHINIGFPALDAASRLISPTVTAEPRDAAAREGAADYARMEPPTPDYGGGKVYFHTMRPDDEGKVTVALVNPACDGGTGFGVYITYRPSELPCFTQWKMMGQGTYVCGLEPGNAHVMGRAAERAAGRLQALEPGERRAYHLEIGVVAGREQIAALEAATSRALARP